MTFTTLRRIVQVPVDSACRAARCKPGKAAVGPALALAGLLCLGAMPAQAQLARTFVSSLGNDANDCNRLTPCRTFQRAHDQTLALGEITVLDPGSYGAVTIAKSISITNDGVGEAGVLVSGGGAGITVNAGQLDAISLRGLTIKGIGFGGGTGIVFNSGFSLTVENCAIRSMTGVKPKGSGIVFQTVDSSDLTVLDTVVSDNAIFGIAVIPQGGVGTTVTLSQVQLLGNNEGLAIVAGAGGNQNEINVVVEDSVADSNSAGFDLTAGPPSNLMLVRSVVANSQTVGVVVTGANATTRVGQSTLTGNATTWTANSGALLRSYGNNQVNGNADGDPAIPAIALK